MAGMNCLVFSIASDLMPSQVLVVEVPRPRRSLGMFLSLTKSPRSEAATAPMVPASQSLSRPEDHFVLCRLLSTHLPLRLDLTSFWSCSVG